jgi:hypothetical protein
VENNIMEYFSTRHIPYAKIYGYILVLNGKMYFEGCDRTGCMFCLFGCHIEKSPNRFQRMKKTHPELYDYCINKLGCGKVLDYIDIPY